MEYKRYVPNIVLAHKVLLRGWPADMPIEKNIDNLSVQNLKGLLAKLRSKEIHWSDASEEELRHIKETTPIQQRAKRCDIGVKRGSHKPTQQPTVPTPVSDDNNGDDNNDNNDNDANVNSNRPQKRKRHPANDGNNITNVNNGNVRSKKAHKQSKQLERSALVNDGYSDDNNHNNIESTAPVRQSRKAKGRSTGVQLPSACLSSMQSGSCPVESSGLVANTDLACLTVNAAANAAARPAEPSGLIANTDLVRLTVNAAASSSAPISHTLCNLAPSMQYGIGSLRDSLDFPQVDFNAPTDDGFLRLPTPLPNQQRELGNHYIFDSMSSLPESSLMFPNFL